MKNHSQWARFTFALKGVRSAWKNERSFRTEVIVAIPVYALMIWAQVGLTWWFWVGLATILVLAMELVNTAIENLCDVLHPGQHPMIGAAKDCGSAAVFLSVTFSFAVAIALVIHILQR